MERGFSRYWLTLQLGAGTSEIDTGTITDVA